MSIQTNLDERYDFIFHFRTTLPKGLLAVEQGKAYYRLGLINGQLFFTHIHFAVNQLVSHSLEQPMFKINYLKYVFDSVH